MIRIGSANLLAQRPTVYGYSNARVKGMRTHLLTKSQLEEMVRVGNVPGAIEILERTHFKQDLVALSLKYSGADLIGVALGRNKARTYRKLIRITPNGGKDIVIAFLRRWDMHNLKTILLGKSMGKPIEKIEPLLVPAGELDEEELKRLLVMDMGELIGYLKKCKFCTPKGSGNKYKGTDIAVLVNELDRVYYSELAAKVSAGREGTLAGLVKAEIDAKNIMLGIRGKREQVSGEELSNLLFEGGRISKKELLKLADIKSRDEAMRKLTRHYDLKEAYDLYKKDNSIVHFEIALENNVAKMGVRALRRSMLSVGAIVGYIYLKDAEIGNIRKIINAIEFGIPEDKLKEMLVLAG